MSSDCEGDQRLECEVLGSDYWQELEGGDSPPFSESDRASEVSSAEMAWAYIADVSGQVAAQSGLSEFAALPAWFCL